MALRDDPLGPEVQYISANDDCIRDSGCNHRVHASCVQKVRAPGVLGF